MTSTPSTTDRARETAGTAQQEGTALAQSAKESGAQVAQTAGSEASNVAAEAKAQAGDLLRTTRNEVNTQVDAQRQRLVEALRTTGDELTSGEGQSTLTSELSQRASTYVRTFADYLDQKGPDAVLDDVRAFARRRPGTFLLLAGAAGVLAGRVFRSVSAASGDSDSTTDPQSFVDDRTSYSDTTFSDTTYSGLGVGATETVPTTPRHAADDTAVGVAEVPISEPYPPTTGSPAGGYATPPVAEPYPPATEPTLNEPYPATGPGYAEGYPAAPPGVPATEPPVDDPFADPRFRDPHGDQR